LKSKFIISLVMILSFGLAGCAETELENTGNGPTKQIEGEETVTCTVVTDGDTVTLTCPDGTTVTLRDGLNGADGEAGEKGDKGDPGDDGEDGKDSIIALINPCDLDSEPEEGSDVIVVLSDGTVLGNYDDGEDYYYFAVLEEDTEYDSISGDCSFSFTFNDDDEIEVENDVDEDGDDDDDDDDDDDE